jgi:hypothetical protein
VKRFAVLLLLGAACAKGATPEATPSPSPTPSSRTSTFVSVVTATPRPVVPSTDLADGTTYAYVKSLDTTRATVTVDVVQFLTGKAAEKAAHDDGKEAFNDYYVRNQSTRLRTLGYAPSVKVVVNTLTAGETGSSTKDTAITLARLQGFLAKGEAQRRLFYVVLKNGVVTSIHEQYLP